MGHLCLLPQNPSLSGRGYHGFCHRLSICKWHLVDSETFQCDRKSILHLLSRRLLWLPLLPPNSWSHYHHGWRAKWVLLPGTCNHCVSGCSLHLHVTLGKVKKMIRIILSLVKCYQEATG